MHLRLRGMADTWDIAGGETLVSLSANQHIPISDFQGTLHIQNCSAHACRAAGHGCHAGHCRR